MKILKIKAKNFGSYGNQGIELDFTDMEHSFGLIAGRNGSGKCVKSNTIIDLEFLDKNIEKEFKKYITSIGLI